MPDLFSEKVFSAIQKYNMLSGVRCVIVALSGGADSMSLLHFFAQNAAELGITVQAAHLNHNIRGEEAKRDEEFVRSQCEQLGVKLHIRSFDIPSIAKEKKLGLEECGRSERYRFFSELCSYVSGSVCATAHTASDNAETVLLNITRGCGTDGLCGIPPVRRGLIRPLIMCTRADVEEYCARDDVPFITDSTNLVDDYSRNRIRLNVIPQLCRINPSVEAAINRLSSLARMDCELIERLTEKEWERCFASDGLDIAQLKATDSALVSHVIIKEISERFGVIPEKRHVDLVLKLLDDGHGAVEIKKDMTIRVRNGILVLEEGKRTFCNNDEPFSPIPFTARHTFSYNGKKYEISDKISVVFNDNLSQFKIHADGKSAIIHLVTDSPENRGMQGVNPNGVVMV